MRGRPSTSTGKGSKKSKTPTSTSTGKGKGSKKNMTPTSPPKTNSDIESETDSDSDDSEVVVVSASASLSSSRSTRSKSPRQITAREVRGAIQSIDATDKDKGKEPRKKRPAVAISEAQEAAALDFLKSHPVLYDRSVKEYKDVPFKEKIWEELADKLTTKRNPINTDDIKKWFESQRTIYGKSTKMVAGQSGQRLSDRKRWVIIEFGFLAGHIARHGTIDTPTKDFVVPEAASQVRTVDYDSDDAGAGPSQSEKRRRVVSPACEVREKVLQPVLPDARRAFCDFIAASVKDIDESLWDSYSMDAFRVLTDYKGRSRALLLPPPPVPQLRLQGTRPAGTSTPIFQQQPQSGGFQQYGPTQTQQAHPLHLRPSGNTGKPSPPKYVAGSPAQPVVPGGSGTAAHNSSDGSIGLLVAEYNELDVPSSLAQMKTPNPLEDEEKDDQ